jgi:allantoin racemase
MKILFMGKAPRKAGEVDYAGREKRLRKYLSPGTEVVFDEPADFDGSKVEKILGKRKMLNGLDHAMVTASIVQKIVWAAENGFDAVVQSNNFEPGVEAGRLSVSIPVVGILRTALHVATTLADRIGIMVPLESHIPYTWRLLRAYKMDGFITDIRTLGIYGDDLKGRIPEITDKAAELIQGLVQETRAHFILPLGGALIPNLVDPADLQKMTGIPVINTSLTALRFAETCVTLGMTHSPFSYPSTPLTYDDAMARA